MVKEWEHIEWDKTRKAVVVTKHETLDVQDAKTIADVKAKLKAELQRLIQESRATKRRAHEIRALLQRLDGKQPNEKPPSTGG
jgi:hypothetical protein